MKIPPYLKKGDTIGITCPAGYMAYEKAATCIKNLQRWGYQVMVGKTLGSDSQTYFSGSDEERRNELQAMLDDSSINAILFARGGYGLSRIIDDIDFTRFKRKPKWLIGYSDITALHCHLNRHLKIASLHSPMAAAFNYDEQENVYIRSLRLALTGTKGRFSNDPHTMNRTGEAFGELVGGNLTLLVHLIGTVSELNTDGKILFIEDIGEYLYSIDRMFVQLKRAGKLDRLGGLVIGRFTDLRDTDRPFGTNIQQAIFNLVQEFDYPVCFDFPVCHDRENFALKSGIVHSLKVSKRKVMLREV